MSERTLVKKIGFLRQTKTADLVRERLAEFTAFKSKSPSAWFREMCFCVLTANFQSKRACQIQLTVGAGFTRLSEKQLARKLRSCGYRFPNTRAAYICANRHHAKSLKHTIQSLEGRQERRRWLVDNIRGLGMKEASHFLRNVGYLDYAIVDFHILDVLESHGMIERPPSMTPRRYLECETVLGKLAKKVGMSQGEFDLYLWYLETGAVLK